MSAWDLLDKEEKEFVLRVYKLGDPEPFYYPDGATMLAINPLRFGYLVGKAPDDVEVTEKFIQEVLGI